MYKILQKLAKAFANITVASLKFILQTRLQQNKTALELLTAIYTLLKEPCGRT